MQPVHLFDLVSRHVGWASFRQTVVTGNIANANTPGFEAQDVKPFADVMEGQNLAMARTAATHLGAADSAASGATVREEEWGVTATGNSVTLEQELIKADEVNRAVALDLSIERAFHRMLLASVRSGG